MAKYHAESGLPFIAFPNIDQIVDKSTLVKKKKGAPQSISMAAGTKGAVVLRGDGIETTVVNTWMKTTLLLGHEEETFRRREGGWVDETLLESLLDVLLHSIGFSHQQGVEAAAWRCSLSRLMAQFQGL